jgi:hypothetical protein
MIALGFSFSQARHTIRPSHRAHLAGSARAVLLGLDAEPPLPHTAKSKVAVCIRSDGTLWQCLMQTPTQNSCHKKPKAEHTGTLTRPAVVSSKAPGTRSPRHSECVHVATAQQCSLSLGQERGPRHTVAVGRAAHRGQHTSQCQWQYGSTNPQRNRRGSILALTKQWQTTAHTGGGTAVVHMTSCCNSRCAHAHISTVCCMYQKTPAAASTHSTSPY